MSVSQKKIVILHCSVRKSKDTSESSSSWVVLLIDMSFDFGYFFFNSSLCRVLLLIPSFPFLTVPSIFNQFFSSRFNASGKHSPHKLVFIFSISILFVAMHHNTSSFCLPFTDLQTHITKHSIYSLLLYGSGVKFVS